MLYIYNNFRNRYFITLEITLIHTVDIEDNKYYLNNIMEKVYIYINISQSSSDFPVDLRAKLFDTILGHANFD